MAAIRSVKEAVGLVVGDKSRFGRLFSTYGLLGVWFRGEANRDWSLMPSVLRRRPDGCYLYDEYQMLQEMQVMQPIDPNLHRSTVDWLVMCQHYGLPTRLLDWTESVLVALYFAAQDDTVDGRLYALRPAALNGDNNLNRNPAINRCEHAESIIRAEQCFARTPASLFQRLYAGRDGSVHERYVKVHGGEERAKLVMTKPIAIYPPRNNVRIARQSGMFTLHGGGVPSVGESESVGPALPLPEFACDGSRVLFRFDIPVTSKPQMKTDLGRLGFHHAALFPEFEYQARHLREKWPGIRGA